MGSETIFDALTFAPCQVRHSAQHKELLGPKDCILRWLELD